MTRTRKNASPPQYASNPAMPSLDPTQARDVRRLFKKPVQQGHRERNGEAYVVWYIEALSDARTKLAGFFNSLLSQFRQAVDDAEPYFITDLHLHHFSRQAGAHTVGILQLELHLASATLDEMEKKHSGQPLELVIGRVLAHVEDL